MNQSVKTGGYLSSSVGKKLVLAVTGLLLFGFVIGHMLGHLQMFAGPDKYNSYAKMLKDLGPVLWVIRFVLAVIFLAHVGTAIRVTMENRKARPVGYYKYGTNVASYASRTMIMSGMLVLAFLVYHLLHFTAGVTNPEYHDFKDSLGRADVYRMFVTAFLNPAVLVSYIVSVFLLCFHLSHGLSSLFQTLGANSPKLDPKLKGGALLISVLIFIGYASVPLAVAAGVIK